MIMSVQPKISLLTATDESIVVSPGCNGLIGGKMFISAQSLLHPSIFMTMDAHQDKIYMTSFFK